MSMTIATWNINSVRLRIDLVERLCAQTAPDVLCLQELKAADDAVPVEALKSFGYPHIAFRGQPGYNGVAILSKRPFAETFHHDFCAKGDARHVAVRFDDGVALHNFYIPAGGDAPDRAVNDKFGHKLDFVDEMTAYFAPGGAAGEGPAIILGDFNIAPQEHDVWSHKQLLKIVSHTPIEVEKLTALQASRGFIDSARVFAPAEQKLYSWWSYRAKDWDAADKGRRLDHIWATPDVAARLTAASALREARGWEKPSDHVPCFAIFS